MTDAEFRTILSDHKDAVYRFAWRMTGSAEVAEDVAQDCFLALLRHPERYDVTRAPLRTFLLAVARNLIRKRWRAERRWDELDDDAFIAEPVDPVRAEIAELVGRAVQSLPPLQREALILAEYDDMSLEEIALTVDAELTTVKGRLHRARENLRKMLAPLRNMTCNL
ncbi:MAG TPA: RNA polymerase sigma factor [Bryobacteraceae bacterium]|nr:RNA polymerase sigma factor [Bryobacteraceae bacterium]